MPREGAVGIVVGLEAEARIARRLGWPVAVGGGTAAGARRAAESLLAAGAEGLVSFGLAGGLDPALAPGALVIPRAVRAGAATYETDPALAGPPTAALILAGDTVLARVADKAAAWRETGASAVDMESGAVAEAAHAAGRPFAVIRAVCDPAGRALPPAALVALDDAGMIGLARVIGAVLRDPRQIPALLALARDAGRARRTLAGRVAAMRNAQPGK